MTPGAQQDMSTVQPPHDISGLLKLFEDLRFWALVLGISFFAMLLSVLTWVNRPMPQRSWKQGILVGLNGIALALLMALYQGDAVLRGEISLFNYTLWVLLASMAGGPALHKIGSVVARILGKLLDGGE